MPLDEFMAVLKAREFVRKVNPTGIPAPVEDYAREVGAVIRHETNLGANEPGWSFSHDGKHYICVNDNDRAERQRFTVCHEVAHVVLGLASDHSEQPLSYRKRPPAEILCDVFAAELLLPFRLFQPEAEKSPVSLASIEELAGRFGASLTTTGSRFADVISTPCAFVLSEEGKIRYASRSKALRDANAWIPPRARVPRGCLSERVREGELLDRAGTDADLWFSEWERGGVLLEEARYLEQWDQTLTLLWFEGEEVPVLKRRPRRADDDDDGGGNAGEEEGLQELDGVLRFHKKRRR
jgi:Zn-dependent peptidase ImmA (M78 family)